MSIRFMAYGRNILLLSIIYILSSLALNLISPLWPLYIRSLGSSMTEMGYVFSISNAFAAAVQIPSGWISDRYGRKRLHAIGTLLGVLPPLLYAFATNWFDLIPWVILAGVSTGLYVPVRWSIVADASTDETRATAYSWVNVAMLTGPTAGPLLGGLIADILGIRTPFFVCFALIFLSFPLTLMLEETKGRRHISVAHKTRNDPKVLTFLSVIIIFSLINVIQGVGIGIFFPITPEFATIQFKVDYIGVGVLYAIGFGLASIVVQIPGGKWAAKYDRKKIMIVTFVLSAPFYGLFALSRNLVELFVFMFLSNAVLNISWPAFQALMMELTPSEKWGLMNGISATTFWAGMMAGSAASGLLWDHFGKFVPYYVSALTIFLSAIPPLFLKEPRRPH